MGLTHETLHGRLMRGIDMKKISSVISLSFLVIFILVSNVYGSSDLVKNKGNNEGTFFIHQIG